MLCRARVKIYENGKMAVGKAGILNREIFQAKQFMLRCMPNQTVYYVGECIDLTGLTLRLNYNDGSSDITDQCGISEFDSSTAGAKTIIVGHGDIFTTFEVTVKEPKVTIPTELVLEAGQEKDLNAIADPSDVTITYHSSDTEVVTVDNGKITAIANGKARVSAGITVNDISYISNCIVTVGDGIKDSAASSPALSLETKGNSHNQILVTVSLNNSDKVCEGDFTLCYDSGLLDVTSYSFDTLLDDADASCDLDYLSEGNKIHVAFTGMEELAKSGEVITFGFDVKTSGTAEFDFYSFNAYTLSGKALETVTDKKIVNVSKTEPERELVSITVDQMPQKTTYWVGESLDTAGLTLKLNYNDGTYETVTEDFTVTGFDSATVGEKSSRFLMRARRRLMKLKLRPVNRWSPITRLVMSTVTAKSARRMRLWFCSVRQNLSKRMR